MTPWAGAKVGPDWAGLMPDLLPALALAFLAVGLWRVAFQEPVTDPKRPRRGLVDCEQGNSVIEFTLVFPLLIQILLLLIQFALLCNARLVVGQAAYNAARSAAVWLPAENDHQGQAVTTTQRQQRIRRAAVTACMPVAKRVRVFDSNLTHLAMDFFDSLLANGFTPPRWSNLSNWQEAGVVGAYVYLRSDGGSDESPRVPVASRTGDAQASARWKRTGLAIERYLYADAETDVLLDGQLLPADDREIARQGKWTRVEPVTVTVRHRFGLTVPWARVLLADNDWHSRFSLWNRLFGGTIHYVSPYRHVSDEVTLMIEGRESGSGC